MEPLVSFVFSFRNEGTVLSALLERLERVLDSLSLTYELIFVNDASSDVSLEILRKKAADNLRIRVLTMRQRYGVVPCHVAGLRYSAGEAVIMMDADLQDPPEVIPELIEKWRAGAEIVSTLRSERQGESRGKMFLTRLAYQILNLFSRKVNLPVEAGDFRLLSRRAVDKLLQGAEKHPYLRGAVQTLGFKQEFVSYVREQRFSGETHFPLFSRGPVETFLSGLLFCAGTYMPPWIFAALLLFMINLTGAFLAVYFFTQPAFHWMALGVLLAGLAVEIIWIGMLGFTLSSIYKEISSESSYEIAEILNPRKIHEPQV